MQNTKPQKEKGNYNKNLVTCYTISKLLAYNVSVYIFGELYAATFSAVDNTCSLGFQLKCSISLPKAETMLG